MNQKNSYSEEEIIDSIVDGKIDESRHHDDFRHNPQVKVVGCGCFDGRKFLINFGIYTVVLMVTAGFFTGFYLSGIFAAMRAGFILTILNTFLKPIVVFFTFPITILTLGLFYFVINAMMLLLTSWFMRHHFIISNFWVALITALFISCMQQFTKKFVLKVDNM